MPESLLQLPLLTKSLFQNELFPVLKKLNQTYPDQITCVGGCIRDACLGICHAPYDMDIIVHQPDLAWQISQALGIWTQHDPFWLDEERKILRIQTAKYHIDVNAIRFPTLEEDAQSRDFTLNSLMVSLDELINTASSQAHHYLIQDYTGGIPDIQKHLLRMTHPGIFEEDPLRILRMIRFKGLLTLQVDPETIRTARESLPILPIVAGERIREEWTRLLEMDDLTSLLLWCNQEKLFGSWFPFLKSLEELDKSTANPISVRDHTLMTLRYLEQIFQRIQSGDFPHSEAVWQYCQENWVEPRSKQMLLKLAALLHDIGKADTVTQEGDRLRFFGHEEVGVSLAEPFLHHQGWSKREIDYILQLIETHMRPHGLSNAEYVSPKAQYRFFRDLGEAAIGSLLLALADAYATKLVAMGTLVEYEHFISEWLDFAFTPQKNIRKPLLNGVEIMTLLNIPPSPMVGTMMELLMEEESLGTITSQEQARQFLLSLSLQDGKKSIE